MLASVTRQKETDHRQELGPAYPLFICRVKPCTEKHLQSILKHSGNGHENFWGFSLTTARWRFPSSSFHGEKNLFGQNFSTRLNIHKIL